MNRGWVSRITQHRHYDSLGQADGNAVAETRIDLTYDAVGQYDTITYYDDLDGGTANLVMTAAYSYDDLGRLTDLTYADSSSATIRSFAWTYNALGEIASHDSDVSSEDVTAYTYDDLGQLLGATYADSDTESYTYDATGNRVTANGSTYTTGDTNQTKSDGTYSYIYDDEGNLEYKYIDRDSSGTLNADDRDVTQYRWDSRNRLAEVVHRQVFNGTIDWKADYQYDAMNHRVASLYDNNGDGVTDRVERYVWDGDRIVLDFVDSDGANNSLHNGTESAPLALATRYLWGPAVDQLLAQETVDDGGVEDVSYVVRDNLGSTRSLVNYLGDVTATYSYDTYGNVTALVGTLTDTRFLYTCQEYDTRLALYYYNARWYDASIGKFVSEDPIGYNGGINLYEYVGANPLVRTDPKGEFPWFLIPILIIPFLPTPGCGSSPAPAPAPAPTPAPAPVPAQPTPLSPAQRAANTWAGIQADFPGNKPLQCKKLTSVMENARNGGDTAYATQLEYIYNANCR